MGVRVLFLDDEPAVGRAVTLALGAHGIVVDACTDVEEFLRVANTNAHDALIIDWNLRKCQGTEVCAQRREAGDGRPIAIMSGKLDADYAREISVAAGADRYIEKPVTMATLISEVTALMRSTEIRLRAAPSARTVFRCEVQSEGTIVTIEMKDDHFVLSNHVVRPRPKEFALLKAILQGAGSVVSKQNLVKIVWGSRAMPTTSIVETSMSRLRTQLGTAASIIETVHGGYRISIEPYEE
jgi:DNA-binding response OmpR family regulator